MYVMISIICFPCSLVSSLLVFGDKAKVNNLLTIIWSGNLILLEMHKNTVFLLVNMEMEAFQQTLLLQNDGDVRSQLHLIL